MASAGPGQRSLAYLRKQGWHAYMVEKWVAQARRRIDVAGFGDILAWNPDAPEIALIQTTTRTNQAARITKITGECEEAARAWLESSYDAVIYVHGWAKMGARGKAKRWHVRVHQLTLTNDRRNDFVITLMEDE